LLTVTFSDLTGQAITDFGYLPPITMASALGNVGLGGITFCTFDSLPGSCLTWVNGIENFGVPSIAFGIKPIITADNVNDPPWINQEFSIAVGLSSPPGSPGLGGSVAVQGNSKINCNPLSLSFTSDQFNGFYKNYPGTFTVTITNDDTQTDLCDPGCCNLCYGGAPSYNVLYNYTNGWAGNNCSSFNLYGFPFNYGGGPRGAPLRKVRGQCLWLFRNSGVEIGYSITNGGGSPQPTIVATLYFSQLNGLNVPGSYWCTWTFQKTIPFNIGTNQPCFDGNFTSDDLISACADCTYPTSITIAPPQNDTDGEAADDPLDIEFCLPCGVGDVSGKLVMTFTNVTGQGRDFAEALIIAELNDWNNAYSSQSASDFNITWLSSNDPDFTGELTFDVNSEENLGQPMLTITLTSINNPNNIATYNSTTFGYWNCKPLMNTFDSNSFTFSDFWNWDITTDHFTLVLTDARPAFLS
jgi:hypothetical protein